MSKLSDWGDKKAGEIYLAILCADDYPEQEPEYKSAKWYDLFWLMIPICGLLPFTAIIKERGK